MNSWQVSTKESGSKLLSFLKSKLGEAYSSRHLKRAIEANLCIVNGIVERFASYKLKTGDSVKFDASAVKDMPPAKFVIEKERILYEDDCLFLYNKPAGIPSDETGLAALLQDMYLVHRLDRDTTGVIIFAKTKKAQEKLISQFRNRDVNKVYLALVDGVPKKSSGTIDNYLGKVYHREGQTLWGVVGPKRGRQAQTLWRCKKKGNTAALLRCFPKTGRTHQIRIHMKEIGHPILGDYRYAKNFRCFYHAKRCMLHALEVVFTHPETEKKVKVHAPIPKDFLQAMKKVIQ